MDKVIKHRFWILLALVPPLVIFGYYSANGAIQEAITKRTGELEGSFKGIPQGTGPNPKFVKEEFNGLDVYNKALRKLVDAEMTRVWTDQLPRMTWPDAMQTFVPKSPRGTMLYRGEFPRQAAFTYKAGYTDQIEKLYESIEPLKMELDGKITGKVRFDRASIPPRYFPPMLVPSEQLWDAQEDIWLLQLLFDAVRNVNRPAENAAKSAVRWVYGVNLVGGTGESILVATAGAGGGGGRMLGRGGDEDEVAGAGMGMNAAMMGPGGFGAGAVQTSVAFNPAEEFGMGTEAAAAMQGGGGGSGNGGLAGDEQLAIARGASAGGGMGMGGMMGFAGGVPIRYIGSIDGKFRERGFYMSVLIDQKKIADFLIELANADWPIRIVRFNVGANAGGAGRPAGGGMMMTGGMGMGNMGGLPDTDDREGRGRGPEMFGGMNPAMMSGGGMGFAAGTNPFGGSMGGGGLGGDPDADYAPAGGLLSGGFGAMGAGGIGPQSMMSGDQIANLFTHPDLVQMDLCGVITIYNPPAGESGEGEAATGTDTAPADASAAPAADAATPAGDAAAPEGEATTTPAAEGTEPAVDSATPATDGSAPATEPAAEPQPTEPAGDTPPAESASGAEPAAAEPRATEPAADAPGDAAPAAERAPGN